MRNASRGSIAVAHPVSGLIVFHGYLNGEKKTMPIDVLYLSLASLSTRTGLTVGGTEQRIRINGAEPDETTLKRLRAHVGRFFQQGFFVDSHNDFEMAAGLASSASGYAALTGAIVKLAGMNEELPEVARLARQGSISAAASVVGGLALIPNGYADENPGAEQVFSPEELADLIVVVGRCDIKRDTQDVHRDAITSRFYGSAVESSRTTPRETIDALRGRDVEKLAHLVESHNIMNYAVLHTGKTENILWAPETISMMKEVRRLRAGGYPVFFSMNTGPNLFCYCLSPESADKVVEFLDFHKIRSTRSRVGGGLRYSEEENRADGTPEGARVAV